LTKSYLTEPVNNFSILFVDEENIHILNTIFYLQKIYPAAREVYSDIQSLRLSSLPLQSYLKDKVLSFETIYMENT